MNISVFNNIIFINAVLMKRLSKNNTSIALIIIDNLDNPQNGGMEITIQGKTVPCIPSNPSITSGASPLDDITIFQRETFFYCEFTPSLN